MGITGTVRTWGGFRCDLPLCQSLWDRQWLDLYWYAHDSIGILRWICMWPAPDLITLSLCLSPSLCLFLLTPRNSARFHQTELFSCDNDCVLLSPVIFRMPCRLLWSLILELYQCLLSVYLWGVSATTYLPPSRSSLTNLALTRRSQYRIKFAWLLWWSCTIALAEGIFLRGRHKRLSSRRANVSGNVTSSRRIQNYGLVRKCLPKKRTLKNI